MEISAERRREIIAALRKGTVPQRGLDFLAVGLNRFEGVIADELADVAQGGAAFKAVRGDYGCGKTFSGAGCRSLPRNKALPHQRSKSPRRRHRSTSWKLSTDEVWNSYRPQIAFLGHFAQSSMAGSTVWRRTSWQKGLLIPPMRSDWPDVPKNFLNNDWPR